MSTSHTISVAVDSSEAKEFTAWLNTHGHYATVGNSTGSYVDGKGTSWDEEADEIMLTLWNAYCESGE